MLAGNNFIENFNETLPWKFSGTSKTTSTTVSVGEFIITIKNNEFVGKKYKGSYF